VSTNPFTVQCPACNAAVSVPCNAPTNTGRRTVDWVHLARIDLAKGWT